MKINNIKSFINPEKARKAVSTLTKDGNLLPVILLESTVTGGRTHQAYKRNGYTEARERFSEEVISAVFWLFGVKMFNKLGDSLGKNILKLPVTEFDVGKDALRTPFDNVAKKISEDAAKAGKKAFSKEALAGFKFGKIILSVIAATSLVGFVLPKINHKITQKMIDSKQPQETSQTSPQTSKLESYNNISLDDFKNNLKQNKPSFKGLGFNADMLCTVAHNLENHPIYKLLATDVGVLSGRLVNSRNNDERVEVAFRDTASIYFYLFCTKHVTGLLQKLSPFGNIAKLDPMAAKNTHELLASQLESAGGNLSADAFKKIVKASMSDKSKNLLEKIKFDNDVVALDKLKDILPENIFKKAVEMSKLQPEQAKLGRVLTKKQTIDVLSSGASTSPEFLMKMYKQYFGEDLVNPSKFISMKQVNSFRDNIDSYIDTVIDYAKKANNGIVDSKVLKNMNNKNIIKSAGFFGAGFLVSAAFLSTIIPKTQYLITKLRTGKNEFPGLETTNTTREKADIKA